MPSAELDQLPSTFTYGQARASGLPRRTLSRLIEQGNLELLARGLYRRTDGEPADLDLVAVARKSSLATLCLTSALAHHGLTDAIPNAIDIALPRGTRTPAVPAPVAWHHFAADTFHLGRELLPVDPELSIGLYSAERSIVDAFRLRRTEGHELGNEALRRWLTQRASQPGALMEIAMQFPRAANPLRQAFAVLL